MEFLNNWLQGIVVAVVIASIIQMILPNGNNKKYIKVVLGIYVVFQIITPVVNKFFNSNFEISSLIDIYNKTQGSRAALREGSAASLTAFRDTGSWAVREGCK